jgi:hypothetical protein
MGGGERHISVRSMPPTFPQGIKPAGNSALIGTGESVPFQNRILVGVFPEAIDSQISFGAVNEIWVSWLFLLDGAEVGD